MNTAFPQEIHNADFCVIGGGMSGLTAAISAARHGAKTILMHDRPVLGGNGSSECRVHVCGADIHNSRPNMRETGILEELRLDNLRQNPNSHWPLWDLVLYNAARNEPNLQLLLNCSCQDATVDGSTIVSVTGWQLTTQTFHTVNARIFADCTGDGILAPLTNAAHRIGREARSEFGESIAPEQADRRTMGMTCFFMAREYATPQKFEAPSWITRFENCDELPYGANGHNWWRQGYWWVELGGEADSIHDTEKLRDQVLSITLGVWDHIKNSGRHDSENWGLEWVQFLPGKRESRRYVGDHVLNQLDVEGEGRFDDIVAYGGWSMDDHHPAGFNSVKIGAPATIFHHAPSPYGIPYRSLYSRNIDNLMFAGRDASCTHAAMSSTRVQGTGCSMGYAVGTAAALAAKEGKTPRDINRESRKLQELLMADDCYLPFVQPCVPEQTQQARLVASQGDAEPVRDGCDRPIGNDSHAWECSPGDSLTYEFDGERNISEIQLKLNSALDKNIALSHCSGGANACNKIPDVVPKAFRLQAKRGGQWQPLANYADNHQRFVRLPVDQPLSAVRFTLDATWGADRTRVYGFHIW